MTVLVAGATGTTGSAVLDQLLATGVPVRALTRSTGKAAQLARRGVESVVADLTDGTDREVAGLRRALTGITAAYLVTPSAPGMAAIEGRFAQAAAGAGVHVVKLSTLGADSGSPLRFGRVHAEAEAAIEAAGGSWTFLQPNGFMQNDLAWAAQVPGGTIAGPVMDAAWSIVDVRDVAAVAAAVLTDPAAHTGRRIPVTGREPRTPRDRVAALAAVLGRDLTPVDVPVPTVLDQLRGHGLPAWQVDGLGELLAFYADGGTTGRATWVAPDFDGLLASPRRRWEDFVTDHQDRFLPPTPPGRP